tara:strand:- start:25799 stop:27310 length:1512 start_codon:yes stop_codon:yes gene_type:complete
MFLDHILDSELPFNKKLLFFEKAITMGKPIPKRLFKKLHSLNNKCFSLKLLNDKLNDFHKEYSSNILNLLVYPNRNDSRKKDEKGFVLYNKKYIGWILDISNLEDLISNNGYGSNFSLSSFLNELSYLKLNDHILKIISEENFQYLNKMELSYFGKTPDIKLFNFINENKINIVNSRNKKNGLFLDFKSFNLLDIEIFLEITGFVNNLLVERIIDIRNEEVSNRVIQLFRDVLNTSMTNFRSIDIFSFDSFLTFYKIEKDFKDHKIRRHLISKKKNLSEDYFYTKEIEFYDDFPILEKCVDLNNIVNRDKYFIEYIKLKCSNCAKINEVEIEIIKKYSFREFKLLVNIVNQLILEGVNLTDHREDFSNLIKNIHHLYSYINKYQINKLDDINLFIPNKIENLYKIIYYNIVHSTLHKVKDSESYFFDSGNYIFLNNGKESLINLLEGDYSEKVLDRVLKTNTKTDLIICKKTAKIIYMKRGKVIFSEFNDNEASNILKLRSRK